MLQRDEYQISFPEIFPPVNDPNEDEIKFVRHFLDEFKIDLESDVNITIQTDPIDFSYFLVHVVRRYHDIIGRPPISWKTTKILKTVLTLFFHFPKILGHDSKTVLPPYIWTIIPSGEKVGYVHTIFGVTQSGMLTPGVTHRYNIYHLFIRDEG